MGSEVGLRGRDARPARRVRAWRFRLGGLVMAASLLAAGSLAAAGSGAPARPEPGGAAAPGQEAIPKVIPGPRPAGVDFPPWNDPVVSRLGYRLPQAIEEFGAPQEVGVVRGNQPRQDAVVFYYPDNSYLYWWGDRLWQIRFDGRYRGEILGVEMGLPRAEVIKRLGAAFSVSAEDAIYQLPDRGFPVRLRLIFLNGLLNDLYLYRADF